MKNYTSNSIWEILFFIIVLVINIIWIVFLAWLMLLIPFVGEILSFIMLVIGGIGNGLILSLGLSNILDI